MLLWQRGRMRQTLNLVIAVGSNPTRSANLYMQIEKTDKNIEPFYAEVIGNITEYKINGFLSLVDVLYRKMKENPEDKTFLLYVGKIGR